ncbi:hypothetical protein H6G36_25600 [Anabaena minutissima FACHB-250]|nr:hypothetical protein [Anabaena minutissima FACHB-250]
MLNLFGELSNDINWDAVSSQGKRLSQAARRNLIAVATICAIGGSFGAGVGLVGNYSPRISFCDRRTNPCTKVETTLDQLPLETETKFIPGYGLQRTAASILGLLLFGAGVLAVAKAQEEAEEQEPQIQLDEQLKLRRLELEANVNLQNLENLAQIQVETHQQELVEAQAEMFFERNPEAIAQYLPKPEPEKVSQVEDEKTLLIEESKSEPELEVEKIPPGIELMLNSDLREVVDAGILNLVGAQGAGKTSTACMLLRYRVWKGHKLIIINPHKKKSMYQGLEGYLMPGTEFYGVGKGDEERAQSLLDGLEFIRQHISDRYDEYQNLDESEYDHFPVTILLEECAEYDGLLSVFNRPANPKESDPGFNAKKYVTAFWKKFFIATRKGNNFGIRTIQFDSNTMNGTDGMADLIKSQGACKLTQFSVPDGNCVGGWRSTGEGEIELPNQKYFDAEGKPINAKPVIVPTWFDYKKILDPSDFKDLAPVIQSKGGAASPPEEKVNPVVEVIPVPTSQSPIPNTQSSEPDSDEDPDELFRRNLDMIVKQFNLNLVQSGGVGRDEDKEGNHPELEEPLNQPEPEELETPTQVLVEKAEETASEKRYTPMQLTKVEVIAAVGKMRSDGMSQTKIIESLWQVKKSRSGWSQAYREFIKELGL